MCGFNIGDVTLVVAEASSPPGSLMCNPAAERSGAKSESEFREAKVGCIQSPLLVLFFLLNASQIPFVNITLFVVHRKFFGLT